MIQNQDVDCPLCGRRMIRLRHIPFVIDGVRDLHNPNAKAIECGCAQCNVMISMFTSNPMPIELTPAPVNIDLWLI